MIIPSGHRVLVKQERYDEHDAVFKSAKAAGLEIVKDGGVRYQASVDKGVIVLIGPTAWKAFDDGQPWAAIGNTVVFARNAGKTVEDPEDKDSTYLVLNDEDIVAVIKE